MLSEHRADELRRLSKDELIFLLLEAERQRNAAQHGLDMFHSRQPGRYAFYCRHLALAYVRRVNPELHQEVYDRACRAIDEQGGKSYQDVVAGLEAACETAERERDTAVARLESLSQRLNTPIAELVDVADVERERDRLRTACEAAEKYIIAAHARKLWNEHHSYDTETARRAAEDDPPPVVLQLRAALEGKIDVE